MIQSLTSSPVTPSLTSANKLPSFNQVATSHKKHFADFDVMMDEISVKSVPKMKNLADNLGDKIIQSINQVNQEIITSDNLTEKMVRKPNSVDIHDVTIALAKADLSLGLTRSVIQRAVSSYQTLINLR